MDAIQTVQRIDDRGRVVIPKELLQWLGVGPGSYVDLARYEANGVRCLTVGKIRRES